MGEIAAAVIEPKIKMADVPFMLRFCSLMHRRYSDFSGLLLDAWKKLFSQPKSEKVQYSTQDLKEHNSVFHL